MWQLIITIITLVILAQISIRGRKTIFISEHQAKNKNPLLRALTHLGGLDAAFRLIQFGFILIAGEMVNNSRFVIDHSRLIMVGKAHKLDKISNFFARARKVCRLSRTKSLCTDLKLVTTDATNEQKFLRMIQKLFGVLGDFCNLAFFFGDHYTSLFLIGILKNIEHQIFVDYVGNVIWTLSNVFYIFRDIMTFLRIRSERKLTNKEIQYLIIDILRNGLDIIINISFLVQGLLVKKVVGILGVTASALWLSDFWRC